MGGNCKMHTVTCYTTKTITLEILFFFLIFVYLVKKGRCIEKLVYLKIHIYTYIL